VSAARRRPLRDVLTRARPELGNPIGLIQDGAVRVDGSVVTNPASLVLPSAAIVVAEDAPLRGEAKLRAALDTFDVDVAGKVALDAGAAAGGFTRVLLAAGATRVYAVDAGHGQLVGALRQDARVVNLEGTNLGVLDGACVPDPIEVVTMDLSYLSIARAVPELARIRLAPAADLVALVKPMFELGLARAPTDPARLDEAVAAAVAGVERAGWRAVQTTPSPVTGARGAPERLLHARLRRT
jgi:23S rRNA (cytidine1920-2'-O)/16S rRNA (cytidine1409-2'-O)-methyltransferase